MDREEVVKSITLRVQDYVGIITIDNEKKLNAMTVHQYSRIAELLDELAQDPRTYVTLITAKGRFFSAGADVTSIKTPVDDLPPREYWVKTFVANAFYNTHAWYSHPKILVAALNGPVVGVSACFISHCDFIYAAPHTYLMTPFSSLGLVLEGAASLSFVSRMGIGLAKEALIMGRRIPIQDLLSSRFVNKLVEEGGGERTTGKGFNNDQFLAAVLREIDDRLGKHLVKDSLLNIKALIQKAELGRLDKAGVAEVIQGFRGFMKGVPQEEFRKIASGEKRHKL